MASFVSNTLSEEAREKAEVELNETEEVRNKALGEVREQLSGDMAALDDSTLVAYLRVAKYDVPKALKRLWAYNKHLENNPDLANLGLCVDEFIKVYESGIIVVPEERDLLGRRVVIFNYDPWDTSKVSLAEIQRAITWLLAVLREDQDTQVYGFNIVQNLSGYSYSHWYQYSPSLLKRAMVGMQCIPGRFSSGIFVNQPFYYSWLYKAVKPLMSEKMSSRIVFIGSDFSKLHSIIPRSSLPAYFDGTANEQEQIRKFVEFMKTYKPMSER